MSASRSIDLLPPTMTPPWTRPLPLPDKPGGETNLLHRDAWATPANPLRVEFKPWYDSPSPIRGSEKVDVFLDVNESNIIGTRTWTLPMEPAEYFIEITADKLPQGEHQISFIMTNYLDVKPWRRALISKRSVTMSIFSAPMPGNRLNNGCLMSRR